MKGRDSDIWSSHTVLGSIIPKIAVRAAKKVKGNEGTGSKRLKSQHFISPENCRWRVET
jgi:hypothetical protein